MRTAILIAVVALLAGASLANESIVRLGSTAADASPPRDAFYCQPPVWGAAGASDGQQTEIADDIPSHLAGQQFDAVTLYISEWSAPWQYPEGLAINIYYSQCPPSIDPDEHYEFAWSELSPQLAYSQPGYMVVYEVTASLPHIITITSEMSIGGYVLIDWGELAPYTGFCFTEYDVVYGCNDFYWDVPLSGIPRWTTFSEALGYYANLAFCLSSGLSDVSTDNATPEQPDLMPCYPNPFNPMTRISFNLPERQHVNIRIFQADGSMVSALVNELLSPGLHEITWDGLDRAGRPAPSGVYFYSLEAGVTTETRSMTLVR